MVKPTSKYCPKCDETFPALAFFNNKARHDGLSVYCKPCFSASLKTPEYQDKQRALSKRWYEKHKDVLAVKRSAAYYADIANRKTRARVYYGRNKEAVSENGRRYRLRQRIKVIEHYGGFCQCCGETRYEFLAIDHIHGCGKKLRKEQGAGNKFHTFLVNNGFPPGYQILCHNCNSAKGFYGQCPHEVELLLEDECQSLA